MMYHIAFNHLNVLANRQTGNPMTRSVKRLEYLKASLQACKNCCEALLSRQPHEYYQPSFDTWARMCRVLMVLARVSQTENLREVSCELGSIIDFADIVDRFAYNFDSAEASAKAAGLPLGNNHLFTRWAWRLRTFKERNEKVNDSQTIINATAMATFPGDDPPIPSNAGASSSSARTPASDEQTDTASVRKPSEEWTTYGNAQPGCHMQ